MTPEKLEAKVQFLLDVHEINQLHGRYNHYLSMAMFDKVVELFAQKDPNVRLEIADSGVYEGIEGVRRLFIEGMKKKWFAFRGASPLMMIMTPVIEVRKDGQRAKGVWQSFGCLTIRSADGIPHAAWGNGKYETEFVKEDGKWKILSLHWYVNFRTPFDKGWVEKPIESSMTFSDVLPDKPSSYYMPYNVDAFNPYLPPPPEPYD